MADEPAAGTFVNLTVPPGAEAGVDSLTFQYGGASLEVLIPPGSVPGDVLRIKVGAAADGYGDGGDVERREGRSRRPVCWTNWVVSMTFPLRPRMMVQR